MAIRARNKKKSNLGDNVHDSTNDSIEVSELDISKKVIVGCPGDAFSFIELLCFTMILPLFTTYIGSSIYLYSPKLIEPYHGNFFPYYFYNLSVGIIILLGILLGIIYEAKFLFHLPANIGRIGLALVLSPIYTDLIARQSMILGPYLSVQLSYLLPVYIPLLCCSWINSSLFLKNCTFFKNADTLNHSITLFVIHMATLIMGLSLLTTFPLIYSFTNLTCYGLLINGLISALILYLLNLTLLQNLRPTTYDKVLVPTVIICILLATISRHAQCSSGLSEKHLDINKPMVNGFIPLARTESITGWITVDEEKAREIRVLRSGHSIIGGIYPNYQESIFGTFYYMETIKFLLPYKSTEERGNVLQIGLGIGVSAKDLIEDDYKVDIIEIDPIVYNYSRTYFELPEPNKVYLEDGRTVLENKIKGSSYDFILHDVFTGGTVPSTLFSIEALQLCKYAMKPDGVLVLNFVGGILGPYNMAFEMVATTLRAVFPYMRLFTEDFKDNEEEVVSNLINLVFFVSDKPIEFDLPPISPTYRSIKEHAITHMEKYEVKLEKYLPQLTKDLELIDKYHSMVVTDKDNKLNQVQHHSAYEHWYKMKELFPLEYWVKY